MQIKILFGRHCKFVLDWFHYVGRLCIPVMIVSECATFMTVEFFVHHWKSAETSPPNSINLGHVFFSNSDLFISSPRKIWHFESYEMKRNINFYSINCQFLNNYLLLQVTTTLHMSICKKPIHM